MVKYEKIAQTIINKIKSGEFKPNTKIPSENELSVMFDTSRVTVRKAIGNVINRGYLYSNQGKGTFVVDNSKKEEVEIDDLIGLSKRAERKGDKTSSSVISLQFRKIDNYLLPLFKERGQVLYYERIRCINEVPIAYEFAYLNPKYADDVTLKDLSNSFDRYVERKGLKISKIKKEFKATIPPSEILEKLKLDSNVPIIKVDYYKYLDNGDLFEYAKVFYNQNLYKIVHTITVD